MREKYKRLFTHMTPPLLFMQLMYYNTPFFV